MMLKLPEQSLFSKMEPSGMWIDEPSTAMMMTVPLRVTLRPIVTLPEMVKSAVGG